ncbi:MAG: thioredoxin family protein [Pseudomonadota bacterium]
MDRRTFLTASAATLLLPNALMAAAGQPYTPGLIRSELQAGKTLFVDFYADWCSTCKRQERIIRALRNENPVYDQQLTFIAVDWDQYRRAEITQSLRIPRRSTLVALKGNQELGRLVAATRENRIKGLMDVALQASVA